MSDASLSDMPRLHVPDLRVHRSFLAAMAEYAEEGRGEPNDNSMIGREMRRWGQEWHRPEVFEEYTRTLWEDRLVESPRPEGHVPSSTFWLVDGVEYLGRIALRHRLTPSLRELGGHVGYDVRPSARRRGHATAMLRQLLPYAAGQGLGKVLVTCDDDNIASRKVIEACGGVFEDERVRKLRYWVPTVRA